MITIDEKQLAKVESALSHVPQQIPRAVTRAVNRAAQGAKTEAVRSVRKRYIIRAKDINEITKIKRATPGNTVAIIKAADSVLPLTKFKTAPNIRPGVKGATPARAKVLRGGSIKKIRSGFTAGMKSGHKGIYTRAGKTTRRKRKDGKWTELPIEQKYGPSIPQMMGHKSVVENVEKVAKERMVKRMDHEVDAILKGVIR